MKRRKAIVGLSVLCALCLSAFTASGASAAGTTAGECTSSATTKDFEDAHCDRSKTPGTFGHVLFPNNTVTSVTAVNDLTGTSSPFLLAGKIAGVVIHVQCNTVSGTGTVTNKLNASGGMIIEFGQSTTNFTNCSVTTPEAAVPCTVVVAQTVANETDPMNLAKGATTTDVTGEPLASPVEETATGTEMGLKFSPPTGKPFTELEFSGASCPAAFVGKFSVSGSAIATGGRGSAASVTSSGATGIFTKASTIKFLKFAGNPATLEGTLTFRKTGGNPLIITTTAS
jgi:hypothetical protein